MSKIDTEHFGSGLLRMGDAFTLHPDGSVTEHFQLRGPVLVDPSKFASGSIVFLPALQPCASEEDTLP